MKLGKFVQTREKGTSIKVIGFGLSKVADPNLNSWCENDSPYYVPPEKILPAQRPNNDLKRSDFQAADIYALGILFSELKIGFDDWLPDDYTNEDIYVRTKYMNSVALEYIKDRFVKKVRNNACDKKVLLPFFFLCKKMLNWVRNRPTIFDVLRELYALRNLATICEDDAVENYDAKEQALIADLKLISAKQEESADEVKIITSIKGLSSAINQMDKLQILKRILI